MKVKIKDKIYDSNEEPIMLILNDQDKENIKNMHVDCSKICSYPEGWNEEEIEKLRGEEEDEN